MSFLTAKNWAKPLLPLARSKRRHRHSAHYEGVLGTSLELQVATCMQSSGPASESAALAEIDRLEQIFNIYRPQSEVRRWEETQGQDVRVSPELLQVLAATRAWTERTGGAFHAAAEALTQLWRYHAEHGERVGDGALEIVARELEKPLWQLDEARSTARRLTRLPIALNSVAKGFIIDRAAQAAAQVEGVRAVLVNIGGDLRHVGEKPVGVAIANPFEDAENAEPVAWAQIAGEGLATSGNYRRGFRVGEEWLSHVLDPRTGRPVEHTVSASVIAPDAMSADILATVFSVLEPPQSVALADSLQGVGVLIIEADGAATSNACWKSHAL
jgi:thiamine biosynthesis lipoprotein